MRKFGKVILSEAQKKDIACHTHALIKNNFKEAITKADILNKNIELFKDPTTIEPILAQSLTKGCFPRLSWPKKLIHKELDLSPKIFIENPNEKADFRYIGEVLIANRFALSSDSIKVITMNSENHKDHIMSANAHTTISKGNTYKDITLEFAFGKTSLDIKSGNNADDFFNGILGPVAVTVQGTPYGVLIDKTISLEKLQEQRLLYLNNINAHINSAQLNNSCLAIKTIANDISLDVIQRNINIQEEMFNILSKNLLRNQPSFFVAYRITISDVHHEFYKHLEPHITSNIFDNKKSFNIFMQKALIAYNVTVQDIVKNVKKKDIWEGTGFADIADDIF